MRRTLLFEVEMAFDDENGGTEVPTERDLYDFLTPGAAMTWSQKNIDLRDIWVNLTYDSNDYPEDDQ